MRPEWFALLAAIGWGVGGFFEKRGLHVGHLAPQVGITVRTAVALAVLAIVSFPQWKTIPAAGPKSLLYLGIGGGVVAGAAGMLCFFVALKGAPLNRVMPIAFTAPFFGALMGYTLGGEAVTAKGIIGMLLTVGGIMVLTVG